MANAALLKKLYLFKDLTDAEIDLIKSAAVSESYGPGDEVFSQGERARALFLIQSGSVKITNSTEGGDPVEITRLGSGAHFGEMSFLDGEARSASAVAVEMSEIIAIDYDKLTRIMIDKPGIAVLFYRQFAHFLCGRLRMTTQDLSFSRSKVLSHF